MHPILDYVEFRTNPEPYMVQGVVHGGMRTGSFGILSSEFVEKLSNRQQDKDKKGKKLVLRRSDFFSIMFINSFLMKGNPF